MTLNLVAARRNRRRQIILEQQKTDWAKYVAGVISEASKNGMK
jgi:hypothetical protein